MDFDYANIKSEDFGSPQSNSLETPNAWKLSNRTGYIADSSFMSGDRNMNIMIPASSIPKSYATLTGGTVQPSRAFGSMYTQTKVSFETSASPDYMSYANAYNPASVSPASYYANSPSANLASVGRTMAMQQAKVNL